MVKHFYSKTTTLDEFGCSADVSDLLPVLVKKGYTVYGVEQQPNQLVPYHKHPSEEMVIVLEGKVRFIIEEEVVDVSAGEVIRISPESVHANVSIADEGVSNLLLSFI